MPTFSLRNLFIFVFASCVYLVTLRSMIMIWSGEEFYTSGLVTANLIASWVLLAIVYASWRLRSALIVHLFGPIATAAICSIILAVDGLPADTSLAEMGTQILGAGCAVSTFFSFPTTTLILLVIAVRRRQGVNEPPTTAGR